jgi:NADH:ubiquinone oxidoreductase subunit K
MTADNLFWLSGLSLILGGFMTFIAWILFAIFDTGQQYYQHPRWFPLNLLVIFGCLLMALGLPGFYARQASETGIWGLLGFVLFFVGLVLSHIAVHSIETVTMPNVPTTMMRFVSVAAPSVFLGIIITGIVTWRSGIYPPSLGIAFILAALVGLLTVIPGLPQIISRNLASTLFPASVFWARILLILQ